MNRSDSSSLIRAAEAAAHSVQPLSVRFDSFEKLGGGSFGVVLRARRKSDDAVVALKVFSWAYSDGPHVAHEVAVLRYVASGSRYLVKYYNTFVATVQNVPRSVIEMEFVPGGELHDWMYDRLDQGAWFASADDAVKIAASCLRGLEYMHANHVSHNDIKPDNIAWNGGACKLLDYGLACIEQHRQGDFDTGGCREGPAGGSDAYWSEERTRKTLQQKRAELSFEELAESDIWALGLTIGDVIGISPYAVTDGVYKSCIRNPDRIAQYQVGVEEGRYRYHPSPVVQNVVEGCLMYLAPSAILDYLTETASSSHETEPSETELDSTLLDSAGSESSEVEVVDAPAPGRFVPYKNKPPVENNTNCYDAKSTLPGAGQGLFCNVDLFPGDVIASFGGVIVPREEVQQRSHAVDLYEGWAIDPRPGTTGAHMAHWANDATGMPDLANNAKLWRSRPPGNQPGKVGEVQALLKAMEYIRAGTEIWANYGGGAEHGQPVVARRRADIPEKDDAGRSVEV